MSEDLAPIGVFDSGVGGLTVLSFLEFLFPHEQFYYLSDSARMPYGNLEKETVQEYALESVSALVNFGVKAVVIACNTVCAYAWEEIKAMCHPVPVFGLIKPVEIFFKSYKLQSKEDTLVILATEATIRSGCYKRVIASACPSLRVYEQACPHLASLVEQGVEDSFQIRDTLHKDLYSLREKIPFETVHGLLLGCSHFPFLKPFFDEIFSSKKLYYVDPAPLAAKKIASSILMLERGQNLYSVRSHIPHTCFVTGNVNMFRKIAQKMIKRPIQVQSLNFIQQEGRVFI